MVTWHRQGWQEPQLELLLPSPLPGRPFGRPQGKAAVPHPQAPAQLLLQSLTVTSPLPQCPPDVLLGAADTCLGNILQQQQTTISSEQDGKTKQLSQSNQ